MKLVGILLVLAISCIYCRARTAGVEWPISKLSGVIEDRSSGYACYENEWDGQQYCKCKPGEIVSRIESVHSNDKEDRKWKLTCTEIGTPAGSEWEYWTTDWTVYDKYFSFEKNEENVEKTWFLVGFKSVHSDDKEDRKFQFFFARNDFLQAVTISEWEKANSWDNKMDVQLLSNQAFVAVTSWHSSRKEDRVWKFKSTYVVVQPPCNEITDITYDEANQEVQVSDEMQMKTLDNRNGQTDFEMKLTLSKSTTNSLTESYSYVKEKGHEFGIEAGFSLSYTASVPTVSETTASFSFGLHSTWYMSESWERSQESTFEESYSDSVSYTKTCKKGCLCTMIVTIPKTFGTVPYTISGESEECREEGTLVVNYSYEGHAEIFDECIDQ